MNMNIETMNNNMNTDEIPYLIYMAYPMMYALIAYLTILWINNSRKLDTSDTKEAVIFMDCPDPDNHMAAIKLAQKEDLDHLHIVVVGHPVNFELTKFDSKSFEFNQKQESEEVKTKMNFGKFVKEQDYEKNYWSNDDSEKLLLANIHTLEQLLLDADISLDKISIYNGGITPKAGLSHAIHDYEEHFMDCDGNIMSTQEYYDFIKEMHTQAPAVRKITREDWCNAKIDKIQSKILDLKDFCQNNQDDFINWYLAGPVTPIPEILKIDSSFANKAGFIKAYAGAWEGNKNLLGGNFNEQVDWDSFKKLFCSTEGPVFKNAAITFMTTETAKQDDWLCFNKDELQDIFAPEDTEDTKDYMKICQLAELWATLKPGDGYQPAFDLALAFDEDDIPFDLHRVDVSVETDPKAFCGERSKLTKLNVMDCLKEYFQFGNNKNQVYAYGYQ